MKTLIAMAVPILPGKTDQWREFTNELKTTYASRFAESRKLLGVRERTFFQSTPMGDIVIVTLEGDDPQEAFANFATSEDDFSQWFREQVLEIHGIDLSAPKQEDMPELVVDSEEAAVYEN